MLYFAYGSNMDDVQMRARCPDSQFHAIASIEGHGLCFPRLSPRRGCGVASIAPVAGSRTWGVVYAISEADLASLDHNEGFQIGRDAHLNGYNRSRIVVREKGEAGRELDAWTYLAVAMDGGPFVASEAYMGHILRGASHWGLPADYVAELRELPIAP